MKCAVHPEVDATGYCRNCGKALCTACSREVRGMIYCEACLADMVTRPQALPAAEGGRSPALATMLARPACAEPLSANDTALRTWLSSH